VFTLITNHAQYKENIILCWIGWYYVIVNNIYV